MIEERETALSGAGRRHTRILLWCFVGLTMLNALFWFTADFGSFVPSSEGAFTERLMMFGITEAGPLAFFFIPMGGGDYVLCVAIAAVILTLAYLSARIPKSRGLTIGACIGIVAWFFFGFAVAGLRIT
jgi:hypothetical protein